MGAWGTTLYSNDTTSAIRDEYIKKLNSGEPNEEITMDLIKEFQALICDTEEQALFWYALADMQLSHGMLMQYVRDKALLCMEDIKESERWARPDQDMVTGWVKTLEALKKVGKANDAGVLQARANVMQLESSQLAICKSISETENALSAILAMPSHSIERSDLAEASFPDTISVGVPLLLLSNRPDVRRAEMELAQAFYATNVARSAFYPNITLSGTLGWTNNGGGVITNPGQWLFNAIASLTQPLFNRGTNIANLKIAQTRQEEARLLYQQSLLNAGKEVNDALTAWQTAKSQFEINTHQVETLREAVRKTELLMRHSGTTYLEILTTQQSLLEAETNRLQTSFDRIQSIIKLYHALGGGI